MALPQDGQNANGLTKVTEIPKGKELIFIDPTTNEGGIITLEDLTTQILKNLTSQTFALDQGNMTLLAALNQLNSKRFFTENIGNTTANNHAKLDRNFDFEAISWVSRDYNEVFGNQWCFIKSLKIEEKYGFQFLVSCQTKTTVATRYYEEGVWRKWSVIS